MDSTSNTGKAKSELKSVQSNGSGQQPSIHIKWYEGLYNKIPCTCLTVTINGVILDANRFACECLGYSRQELVETSIFNIFNSRDKEKLHLALTDYRESLTRNINEEFRLVTKNGRNLWVKLTLDILQPVGQKPILLLICEEVTEAKRLEVTFQETQSQVQLLMDAFPGKVSYIDAQRCYRLISKRYEEWSLISPEEIIGQTVKEFMTPLQYQNIEEYIELAISGQSVQYEFDSVFNDGKRRYLLVDHVPHISKSGEVLGFFVFCQDLSDRKKVEEKLRQFNEELENRVKERTAELEQSLTERKRVLEALREAEEEVRRALLKEQELSELKSRFLSTTSHEFRTPLTTILSSSEMLERYWHKWSEETQFTHLHRIQHAVKQMTQMLHDVLTLSQAEAGKLEFNPEPLDLEQFCNELVEDLQLNDGERHIIAFESECKDVLAILDAKLLRHILTNLLTNALKYSPNGTTVRFSVIYQEQEAIFQIQDQGIGIPKEDTKCLFDSFYRATNVGTIQGTGLGLAIVKQCVDIYKGKIAVDSVVGKGTTFTVTLPLRL
ncbi:MAG: PAS domain-containing sensor histidine kinase [Symplocastrum torsivum CPER-KK1]|uniref:histidine kinase n=1 Tax=Symplocastrum torsivum CPER-KK1 TaxID=450513 RepID=A0A951U8W5_9CYAN|nr:PAS domain-containing sensor histidine kinase [Symplocastrum torsivum CPER-KK1]